MTDIYGDMIGFEEDGKSKGLSAIMDDKMIAATGDRGIIPPEMEGLTPIQRAHEENFVLLQKVLRRCARHNEIQNPEKLELFMDSVEWMGKDNDESVFRFRNLRDFSTPLISK